MEFKLKTISEAGIPEAISKVELYRSLNEPEEAESICRDILAVEPEHQLRCGCWAWRSPISSVETHRIAPERSKNSSRDSSSATSASTTPVCCMNGAQKHKCAWDARRTRLRHFSRKRCAASRKPK